ncbi:MAG: ribosome small subunit-dependent GTPase A [Atopobiaceae bacterium]
MKKRVQNRHKHSQSAGRAQAALPALSSLEGVPKFQDLRPTDEQKKTFEEAAARLAASEEADSAEYELGCVVRLDRGFPAVLTGRRLARAEFAAGLTKERFSKAAVGDWVCVRCPEGHDGVLLEEILPRTSALERWRGGARGERQTLAANVGLVLVAQALGPEPVSCERLARSAVVVRDCGANVACVLTKADRAGGAARLEEDVRRVRNLLGDSVPIVVTAQGEQESLAHLAEAARALGAGWGAEDVLALVAPGTVACVLGESGAGKSTLLNALLGRDLLRTGSVRASDDAGRHTTVSRRMVAVPSGGTIVDMPGIRSLPLVGHERGLALVFPEISEAARSCRFRDCTHTHEPGCAVREALADGVFSQERYDAYVALAQEMRRSAESLDPDIVL